MPVNRFKVFALSGLITQRVVYRDYDSGSEKKSVFLWHCPFKKDILELTPYLFIVPWTIGEKVSY
jgi:hypothetical protein